MRGIRGIDKKNSRQELAVRGMHIVYLINGFMIYYVHIFILCLQLFVLIKWEKICCICYVN